MVKEEFVVNVAMCIPTYNRAEVVEDTLSRGIEGYTKMGIDLYYYDGSDNDDTRKVVEKYINKGYKNIKYMSLPTEPNRQAMIYAGKGLDKEYDYIWPVKDRVWFEEPTLRAVEKVMEDGHDAIFLGVLWSYAHPGIGTKTYEKPEEFYLDWGYLVTSLDVNIFKYDSMLMELTYEELNDYNPSFIHFQIMFQQLSEGKRSVRALVGDDIVAYNSKLAASGWKKNAFLTWEERWIDVNEKLPECYSEYKAEVIKHAGRLPWLFGTVDSIIEFKNCGAFVQGNLNSILKNWERVSDIPREKVIAIANGTYDKRHDLDFVPKQMDEFLNLLIQMSEFVRLGKMSKEQIPYNDVFQGIMNKIVKKYNGDSGIINVTAGSVEDTLIYIRDKAKTTEEISMAFQILITITITALR